MDRDNPRRRPLFAVGGDVYRWEDVVAFARLRGDWDVLADDVRRGLAAVRELELRGELPGDPEVEEAGREFRHGRGLLAGDELVAWLDRRGLTRLDWRAYLQRLIARRRVPEPPSADLAPEDTEACMWPEAVCSGRLDELALILASLLAVAPGASPDALDDVYDAFRRDVASNDLVAREVETNRLEWLRFAYEAADFDDEDAAREAALCVRDDGDALAEVATRAGVALERRFEWLEEIEPELASAFLAARPGDLVGPLPAAEGFRLALLLEKTAPSADDEAVRERAATAVAERALEHETNERVVWLDEL